MDNPSMKMWHGILALVILTGTLQARPSFSDIPQFFSGAHIVTGSNASDSLAASLLKTSFREMDIEVKEGTGEKGNLILVGGPLANTLTEKYSSIFGIAFTEEGSSVTISVEGKGITHNKSNIYEDIAIAYLGEHEGREILLLWGYGRKGTYASCLYLSKRENWSSEHLLFMVWNDKNRDGVVTLPEIDVGEKVTPEENMIHVTLLLDYGTTQERKETQIKKGSSVLDLLRQETQVDYTVWPFGVFVTSINGLANDATRGHYWLYWVNGVYATVSSDAFVLQEGDFVEWRYKKP
jgi:hypothetical protein